MGFCVYRRSYLIWCPVIVYRGKGYLALPLIGQRPIVPYDRQKVSRYLSVSTQVGLLLASNVNVVPINRSVNTLFWRS